MKEPISEAWLTDEALRIAGNLLDERLERDASVIHQLVRHVRQGSDTRIAELETERDRIGQTLSRTYDALYAAQARIAELEAERQNYEAEMFPSLTARIAELEAEVARLTEADVP